MWASVHLAPWHTYRGVGPAGTASSIQLNLLWNVESNGFWNGCHIHPFHSPAPLSGNAGQRKGLTVVLSIHRSNLPLSLSVCLSVSWCSTCNAPMYPKPVVSLTEKHQSCQKCNSRNKKVGKSTVRLHRCSVAACSSSSFQRFSSSTVSTQYNNLDLSPSWNMTDIPWNMKEHVCT